MNLKSRKLIASAVVFGAGTAGMFMKAMTPEQWMDISMWVLAIYVGGNSLEHLANGLARKK